VLAEALRAQNPTMIPAIAATTPTIQSGMVLCVPLRQIYPSIFALGVVHFPLFGGFRVAEELFPVSSKVSPQKEAFTPQGPASRLEDSGPRARFLGAVVVIAGYGPVW
jgi:hypothetical protein